MTTPRALLTAAATAAILAAASDTTVTVVGFPGLFAEQFEELVIAPYEEANPGVDIVYEEQSTSAESIGRVASSGGTYDLAIVDKSAQGGANEQGLFQQLDAARVPNLEHLVPEAESADGFGPSIYIDSLALLYNTEQVDEAPTQWSDLFDERYDGEVAVSIENAMGLSLLVGLSNDLGTDYQESIDPALEEMKQLGDGQALTFAPSPDAYTMVASGSATLSLGWYARGKDFAAENPSFDVVVPEGSGVALTPTVNLVESAPEEEAALDFLDYAIGEEAQGALARDGFYGPVNANVELSAEELAASAAIDGGVLDGGIVPDWDFISQHTGDWTQRIKREVIDQ
jgi:putative spermidine/putrescine transport system substrate-binding protein